MAGETTITVIGNLTDDPELRFTPSGAAVAKFRIASTPRTLDRQSGEWKDGEPLFLACNIWRDAAEHVAESLQRGARVIVSGRLRQRSYETREGEKRTVIELEVDEIGPSLRYATAKVQKMSRSGGGGGGFGGRPGGPRGGAGKSATPGAFGRSSGRPVRGKKSKKQRRQEFDNLEALRTRVRGWFRIAVSGPTEEEALAYLQGLFDGYEVVVTDSAPAAPPGLDRPAAAAFVEAMAQLRFSAWNANELPLIPLACLQPVAGLAG